ncbi:MAG TPA: spore coat associated protein CotJA, partial [Mobilitalea sp.]|nr:spore coat associated protein CotJA [Mobilitalea sp.]
MDRRMYRGNMGRSSGISKDVSPYRPGSNCDVTGGFTSDDPYASDMRECDGGDRDRFPIGMCYVPWQCFRNLYENEFEALANGTIFKE